jgi:hypothetical protein
MYLDDNVIDDIQGRLADGRLPSGETDDTYYSRYEVDQAWLAGTGAPSRRFRIMDYPTRLSYHVTIEQADGESEDLDRQVIDDIQGRLADGRVPSGETEGSYYDRYEVDEAWIAGTGAPSRRFRIMDYRTGLSYHVAIEQADGESEDLDCHRAGR